MMRRDFEGLFPVSKVELDEALRAEVDHLCDEAMSIEDRIEAEVNYRLRETLLRLADRLKESA